MPSSAPPFPASQPQQGSQKMSVGGGIVYVIAFVIAYAIVKAMF